ncbi:MAG: Histone H1 [candidate division TM6 bacterium GW2011_GWF2_38_10]|nr:MAG: Histone H1 [candidate division TM6 bacterium GW2011_GWF2_38_10]
MLNERGMVFGYWVGKWYVINQWEKTMKLLRSNVMVWCTFFIALNAPLLGDTAATKSAFSSRMDALKRGFSALTGKQAPVDETASEVAIQTESTPEVVAEKIEAVDPAKVEVKVNIPSYYIKEDGKFSDIACGSTRDGKLVVYALDENGKLFSLDYKSTGKPWDDFTTKALSGVDLKFIAISHSSDGNFVALDEEGRPYRFNQQENAWIGMPFVMAKDGGEEPSFEDIAIANDHVVYAVDDNQLYFLSAKGWELLDDNTASVAASVDGTLTVLNPEGYAFLYQGTDEGWKKLSSDKFVSIAAVRRDLVMALDAQYGLWQMEGEVLKPALGENGEQVRGFAKMAINAIGTIAALDADGVAYRSGNEGVKVVTETEVITNEDGSKETLVSVTVEPATVDKKIEKLDMKKFKEQKTKKPKSRLKGKLKKQKRVTKKGGKKVKKDKKAGKKIDKKEQKAKKATKSKTPKKASKKATKKVVKSKDVKKSGKKVVKSKGAKKSAKKATKSKTSKKASKKATKKVVKSKDVKKSAKKGVKSKGAKKSTKKAEKTKTPKKSAKKATKSKTPKKASKKAPAKVVEQEEKEVAPVEEETKEVASIEAGEADVQEAGDNQEN